MAKINKKSKLILIAILLLAAVLRLWKITDIPVSLFGDELDVGYHAYSILKTGKDYSGNLLPLHFQSLAEWRTPLYLYTVVPTVALFGISPLGVRLPAVIFGILGIWGIYLLTNELVKKKLGIWDLKFGILPALFLALSPWHIQYSRAAFEVTQLLAFLIFGLYFFFRSFDEGKYLWISVALLVLTPLIYSTAKLFTPLLLVFLFVVWRKNIFEISKRHLFYALAAGFVLGGLTSYATLFSGGGQRFGYIGVFTDPALEPKIGAARQLDSDVRGDTASGLKPSFSDRFFHNKFEFWKENISDNYLQALSTDFLFIEGDPNPRHSPGGIGQFYKIEFFALLAGIALFFAGKESRKSKLLVSFWVLAGIIPSSLTRDGGNHATRLILILPPLVFLIAYGINKGLLLFKGKWRVLVGFGYAGLLLLSFIFYQHYYLVHYPWETEQWWHAGFEESIKSVKELEDDYERVIITMADEPAWIFFAGWYEYPPEKWQTEFPIGNDEVVDGFGKISHTGKFYFGPVQKNIGIHGLHQYLGEDDLYLASAKEVAEDLVREPNKKPAGLELVRAISYPSGEPAFYLFDKQ